MFLSSNFLFLMSLALISWVLLCYLNEIDEGRQLSHQFKHRLRGNTSMRTLQEDLLTDMPPLQSNYEAFVTFLCIISGFIVFIRFILSAEKNCYAQLRATIGEFQKRTGIGLKCPTKEYWPKSKASYGAINVAPDTFTMDDYRKLSESQHEQVLKLQRRNSFLESRIRALEQQNLLLMGRGLLRARAAGAFRCDEKGNVVLTGNKRSLDIESANANAAGGDHEHEHEIEQQTLCAGIVYSFLQERNNNNNDDDDLDDDNDGRGYGGNDYDYDDDDDNDNLDVDDNCENLSQMDGNDFENVQLVPIAMKRRIRGSDVFIANRFFHINHQVYIMEGNVKLHFENFDCGDFTQMWQKYFELQRLSKKSQRRPKSTKSESMCGDFAEFPRAATATKANAKGAAFHTVKEEDLSTDFPGRTGKNQYDAPKPKIVTTEQLEAIHGLVD